MAIAYFTGLDTWNSNEATEAWVVRRQADGTEMKDRWSTPHDKKGRPLPQVRRRSAKIEGWNYDEIGSLEAILDETGERDLLADSAYEFIDKHIYCEAKKASGEPVFKGDTIEGVSQELFADLWSRLLSFDPQRARTTDRRQALRRFVRMVVARCLDRMRAARIAECRDVRRRAVPFAGQRPEEKAGIEAPSVEAPSICWDDLLRMSQAPVREDELDLCCIAELLSDRECEILNKRLAGDSIVVIARALGCSRATVYDSLRVMGRRVGRRLGR